MKDFALIDPRLVSPPAGSECTLCGSEMECHETGQSLDSLLVLNGSPGLHVSFQSNQQGRGCGFRLLATCARRTLFETSNCTLPEPLPPPPTSTPFPPDFSKRVSVFFLPLLTRH